MVSTCYFLVSCYYSNLVIPSQPFSCPSYLQLSLYLGFPLFDTIYCITSKVAVDPHAAYDPQDPHLDGVVDDPQKPCPDVDTEVANLEVDPALTKKLRVKPKPMCRKKGKLSKKQAKEIPCCTLTASLFPKYLSASCAGGSTCNTGSSIR